MMKTSPFFFYSRDLKLNFYQSNKTREICNQLNTNLLFFLLRVSSKRDESPYEEG
jgi:hypothetical protein